jgi:hypothetical protein
MVWACGGGSYVDTTDLAAGSELSFANAYAPDDPQANDPDSGEVIISAESGGSSIPEPGTSALCAAAVGLLGLLRRQAVRSA